ncbi:hypothetical protein ACHAWF_018279 [Thalassiosira exigua]
MRRFFGWASGSSAAEEDHVAVDDIDEIDGDGESEDECKCEGEGEGEGDGEPSAPDRKEDEGATEAGPNQGHEVPVVENALPQKIGSISSARPHDVVHGEGEGGGEEENDAVDEDDEEEAIEEEEVSPSQPHLDGECEHDNSSGSGIEGEAKRNRENLGPPSSPEMGEHTYPKASMDTDADAVENDGDIDDSFPRAKDFLADENDDGITLANQASDIVGGFNDDASDDGDDAKTIATHRTTGTRVQPMSAAFRSAVAQKEEAEQKSRHPHQSIFDILDRNFLELGDGSSRGGRQVGYKQVKLCFVAFVAVFSLPSEPIVAAEDSSSESPISHQADSNGGTDPSIDGKAEGNASKQDAQKECVLQRVPLSVAFALWKKVLQRTHVEKDENDHLSYVRSTLVLLGMLDLAAIERDRDDGLSSPNGQPYNYSNRSIECLVVHDNIHQQYGEYLAWGDHEDSYRPLIESGGRQWNEAVTNEAKRIGSNQYTLRMLPLNTMRANRMQATFDLLNDMTFVRRRIRVLGASGAAKAHVGDVDELLGLIEKQVMNGDATAEAIDQQEGLLGAYQQVLSYCLHETEELTKPHTDNDGSITLGKTAMYRTTEIGNALHLLGASLGGYGFFDEEMHYYKEALRIKKLSCNGDIEKSVSASDTLHSMGFSLDNAGNKEEALECYDHALEIRLACLGEDDLRVAETQHNKGALLCEEDRAEEAMECLEEALRIREIHYGEEHESCADTMQWMGNLLRKHGDPSEALEYFKFALSIKQKRLGGDDIDVANTLFNTAVLLDDIEKYELSLVAYKEALRIRKLHLGEKNQEVADTLFCMGNVATVMENHDDALRFYTESIEIREELIRNDDPLDNNGDTLLFISNPTSPHSDLLLQYEKLGQSYEEALPLTKLIEGTNHPSVCNLLNRMGEVYIKLQDWDMAIGSFQGALRVKRSDAPEGQEDLEVAALLQKKGEAHLYKSEFIRAKATFDSANQINKNFAPDSMAVASSTFCLGVAYFYLNDYSHARLLFFECMRIQRKLSGEGSPCVVKTLCWIGRQHERLKEPEKALERYLSGLQMYKKVRVTDYRVVAMLLHASGRLYEDDKVNLPDMALKCYNEEISLIGSKLHLDQIQIKRMLADAYFKLGMLHKRRGDTENAIEECQKSLELTEQCDGEDSIKVATISDNLGMLLKEQKDFAEAKKHYSTAYSVYEKSVGRDDLTTSDCAFRLGQVLEALKSDLALDFYTESLRVHRANMAEDDERVGDLLFCSGRMYFKKEAYQDAAKCLEEALGIRKRLLGDSSDVADTYYHLGKANGEMAEEEKALIFYKESVRINKKINEKAALYRVSLDMAKCATECSHFQLAIDCYNDCLQGIESLDNRGRDTSLVLQRMGEIYMVHLKNFANATRSLLDGLEILRGIEDKGESESPSDGVMGLVLLVAQAYALEKKYENSLEYYEEYIDLVESIASEDEDALANALYEMGKVHSLMESPDYDQAIEKLLDCLGMKKAKLGSDDEQVADVVYTLATVYEKAGYHEKATESFSEALRSYKLSGNQHGSVKVYHALGRLKASEAAELDSLSERSAAIESYEEALKIRRQIMSLDDIELAALLTEYGNLLCLNHEHETALPLLEEALRIQKAKNGLRDQQVGQILLRMAEIHTSLEKYDASLVCLEQVLFIQSSLGDDHDIDLGLCHFLLGTTYLAREDYSKATASFSECLELRKVKFGQQSLECASVYNELGKAYGKLSEYQKAIDSLVHALKIRKSELGNDSLVYGHSVLNLAEIHIAKSNHDQALNCLNEALRVYDMFPDEMETTTADVLELKGDTLCELDDYETAAASFQESVVLIDAFEMEDDASHGSSHACNERAARLNYKMGDAFMKLGDYEEALESYQEAISIFSKVLGSDDLHIGELMYDVGRLLVSQGSDDFCEKSMECFNEVIRIYETQGKGKDRKVADAMYQKSSLLADCSEYDEASSILDEAIDIYKALLSEDAAEIGKAMLLYGRLHDAQGKSDESLNAFDEALRIFQMALGEDDINVSLALQNIGIIHARKQEYTEAVEKCKMALKIRVKRGDQDQDVADAVFNIGRIYIDSGKEDEAYQYFQQALKLYMHLGEEDVSVANCQQRLGVIHLNRKDVDSALHSFHEALHICEEEKGDDVTSILASIYRGIGDCHFSQGRYDEALDNFAKCIRMLRREFGDDCPDMVAPCDLIGLIYQKKEMYDKAMNFHSKALAIAEKQHGEESKECSPSDFQIARVLLSSEKYDECIERLNNHLKKYCKGSDDSEEVAEVYHPLGLAQSKVGKYEESLVSLNKALDIRTKIYGKADLKVAETMLDLGKVLEDQGDSEEVSFAESFLTRVCSVRV